MKRKFMCFYALLAVTMAVVLGACGASPPPGSSREQEEVPAAEYQGEQAPLVTVPDERDDQPEARPAPESVPHGADIEPPSSSQTTREDQERESPLPDSPQQAAAPSQAEREDGMIPVNITIGGESFAALFYDNEAAQALIAQMPLTITMTDLNRNEKFYYFEDNLHSSATEQPSTIHAGEIMCWSGNSLVLFYQTFSNSYGGYVGIGYIEDTQGLAEAVGAGSVTVTFGVV